MDTLAIASPDPFPGRPQKHAAVVTELLYAVMLYLKRQSQSGGICLYRASYQLPGESNPVMTPDISVVFISEDELVDDGPAPYMPPLVMDVRIPEESMRLMRQRAEYYLAHGTQLVIIVHVEKQCVETYDQKVATLYSTDAILVLDAVLPGFTLAVRELF
jgi:Uma2 family endonuclease